MEEGTTEPGKKDWHGFCSMKHHMHCHGGGGALYGLGFLGALVYYLMTATSIWTGLLGIVKAILWPAFLVYGLFRFLGM